MTTHTKIISAAVAVAVCILAIGFIILKSSAKDFCERGLDCIAEKHDVEEAVKWYRLAASLGDGRGQCAMGDYYQNVQSLPHKAKVGELCDEYGNAIQETSTSNSNRRLAEPGELADADGYAVEYVDEVNDGNYRESVKWFRKAATNGDAASAAYAQKKLADCYAIGKGVEPDREAAFELYRKSASYEVNHDKDDSAVRDAVAEAQYKTAMYCRISNPEESLAWFRKADANGHPRAEKEVERLAAEINEEKHTHKLTIAGIEWTYRDSDGEAYIKAVAIAMADTLEIPASLDGLPVVGIKSLQFEGKTLAIPDSVREVGDIQCKNLERFTVADGNPSFSEINCLLCNKSGSEVVLYPQGLTEIVIPDNVQVIPSFALAHRANLKKVTLGKNVMGIGDDAFYDCKSLVEVHLSENLIAIHGLAFYGCESLESIVIPSNTTLISPMAFTGCKNLKEFTVSDPEVLKSILRAREELAPDSIIRLPQGSSLLNEISVERESDFKRYFDKGEK